MIITMGQASYLEILHFRGRIDKKLEDDRKNCPVVKDMGNQKTLGDDEMT